MVDADGATIQRSPALSSIKKTRGKLSSTTAVEITDAVPPRRESLHFLAHADLTED